MRMRNTRVSCPAGNWNYDQLVGAEVKIKSMPISNFFTASQRRNLNETLTIKDIYFRVSTDGKAITILELNEIPEMFVTLKDVEIVKVNESTIKYNALCGNFCAGQSICGHNVEN